MEDVIAEEYDRSTLYVRSLSCRYVIQLFPLPLGDGHVVKSCGFKTRFQAPLRNRGHRHARVDESEEATAPLRAVDFDTLPELKANTNARLVAKKKPLLDACGASLDAHVRLVADLRLAEARGLDGLHDSMQRRLSAGFAPNRRSFLSLAPQAKLQVALRLWGPNGVLSSVRPEPRSASDTDQRTSGPKRRWRKRSTAAISPRDVPLPSSILFGEDSQAHIEALRSHICPTRMVAFACLVILMAETGLNKQTLKARTTSDIEPLPDGYRLRGIKSKTDQVQTRDIFRAAPDAEHDAGFTVVSPLSVRALEVLLGARVDPEANQSDPVRASLFRVLRFRAPVTSTAFKVLLESEVHRKLRRQDALWSFPLSSLRNLALQVHYTSPSGSVFSTAAMAGHRNIDVTAGYLEETVIAWMHESNINKFMKMLGATILWVVGREETIAAYELTAHVSRRLLFPLTGTAPQPRSSTIDDWIASAGNASICIGVDEIHHTAIQRDYYERNLRDLAQANPTAFIKHHLPRVVVCEALRQLILASPHKGLLRAFEDAIHANHASDQGNSNI